MCAFLVDFARRDDAPDVGLADALTPGERVRRNWPRNGRRCDATRWPVRLSRLCALNDVETRGTAVNTHLLFREGEHQWQP
jgi:hypothetical protein